MARESRSAATALCRQKPNDFSAVYGDKVGIRRA
jgi:hypothetical protein